MPQHTTPQYTPFLPLMTTTDPGLLHTNRRFQYVDPAVPAVRTALLQQQGSTWPEIPWNAPSSWNGWMQCPLGLEFHPAVTPSGPAAHARHEWSWLPDKDRDDFYMIGGATFNTILLESTFASTQHVSLAESRRVMTGFLRAVKATTGVSL